MTSAKTRKIIAALAATAALTVAAPAAAQAATYSTTTSGTATTYSTGSASTSTKSQAQSGTTPTTGTTTPTYSTLRNNGAYSNGQEGSASDDWCEQAADIANYYHDLGVNAYLAGENPTGDKYMAQSEDISTQAEDAGCVVIY